MIWRGSDGIPAEKIEYKPVVITKFAPKPRVY
ncbi:MAG: hypothetical protein ACKN9R_05045 [Candidatus Limnocylindrus sp.]